ncbi:MAG: polysaccharide deacetylase family protein [Acidobacteria bacterium]|nr:polysaccharide deacetylase family protein [Acidobacteriota bacterium]
MLRTLVKTGSSHALHLIGMDSFLRGKISLPVVLGYHRVVQEFSSEKKSSIPSMLISRQMFERHLDWLGGQFHFLSLDELGATLERGGKFDRPVAAITFDDGYEDNYYNAFPVLKQKGIPAAVFVVTELLNAPQPLLHDKLYGLLCCAYSQWPRASRDLTCLLQDFDIGPMPIQKLTAAANNPFAATRELLTRLSQSQIRRITDVLEEKLPPIEALLCKGKPLTQAMLAEMIQAGITIGSHTQTHILLTNESRFTVQQELESSRRDLEGKLGIPIRHFAYPDGRFNRQTVQAVAAAGYRYGYTICRHRDPDYPLLTIPRRVLWENSCVDNRGLFSSAVMSCQMSNLFDWYAGCEQDHRSLARDPVRWAENRSVGALP